MSEETYKYWAFISYSHQDQAWGDWLHRGLETYRVPRRLVGRASRDDTIPRRLFPIFRDRAELPSSADLGGVINEALRQSRYLIVICSPRAAASRWVDGEIRTFKSLGRADRVLHLIVDGEPNADDHPERGLLECLPLASRFHVDTNGAITAQRTEPVAADARGGKDGRSNARLKLIAGLLNVSFDELRQRERTRQRWGRLATVAAAAALLGFSFAGWRWQQTEKRQALAQQELTTHIAQVYESGRQELLAHNEARAAVYLNEAYRLGVDTPALRFMLGRAMRTVDAQQRRIDAGKRIFWIDWSPDGRRLLTVDSNDRARIWDVETGARITGFDAGDAREWCSGFSSRGSLIWSQTWDKQTRQVSLRIWNAGSGELVAQFEVRNRDGSCATQPIDSNETHVTFVAPDKSIVVAELDGRRQQRLAGGFSATAFCDHRESILAGEENGEVSLRDALSGQLQQNFMKFGDQQTGAVVLLSSIKDCAIVAAGANDGALRVWDGANGHLRMSGGQTKLVRRIWLDRDGASLMSTAVTGATIWNLQNGAVIYAARFQRPVDTLIRLNPNGRSFADVEQAHFRIFDSQSGTAAYSLDGHSGSVSSFSFSADGERLATSGDDDGVVIWQLPNDLRMRFSHGDASTNLNAWALEKRPAAAIAFDHKGDKFFIGGSDGIGEIRDAASLQILASINDHEGPLSAVAFSANDTLMATGGWDERIQIRSIADGETRLTLPDLGGRVRQLAFDPSGRWLSASVEGHRTRIWNLESGTLAGDFIIASSTANAFSPTGSGFAIANNDEVKLWDTAHQRFSWTAKLPMQDASSKNIWFVRFNESGGQLIVAAEHGRIFLLDAQTGHLIRFIDAPAARDPDSLAFSTDGQHVAFGDVNRAFLWQLSDNRILTLPGSSGFVENVVFSPNSHLLLTAGDDGNARIWDAETGDLLDTVAQHHDAIGRGSAAFGIDGNSLLLGGSDNSASLWRIPDERRSTQQISRRLRCRVPWRLAGNALEPTQLDSSNCVSD